MSLLTVDKIPLLANRQFSRAIFMPRDPECLRSEVQLSKKHDCDISHKKQFLPGLVEDIVAPENIY